MNPKQTPPQPEKTPYCPHLNTHSLQINNKLISWNENQQTGTQASSSVKRTKKLFKKGIQEMIPMS